MTVTDAHPAPAAEALAEVYVQDMNTGPSPEDDRACEGRGLAGAGATVGGAGVAKPPKTEA